MATVLFKSQYAEYKHDAKKNVPLDKLFVEIYVGSSPKLTRVSLADLYIITGTKDGLPVTRKIKTFAEFESNFKKNKVYNSATATQPISHKLEKSKIKVEYKEINVPNTYNSTSIDRKNAPAKDIVPYGLKRNLTVSKASTKEDDNYLLAEVGGRQEFLKKNEIYYYNNANERVYLDKNTDFSKLSGKEFFTKEGKIISKLYVENEYVFSKLNARETLDVVKMTKTTYEVKETIDKGKLVVDVTTTTVKLDSYISEQKYVTVTEDDETKPGATKTVGKVAVRNFEISANGEYVSVMIGSSTQVVKLTDVKDENGNDIADIKTMFGKIVKIKLEDGTLVETEPLTYEQVNVLYSVKKFYEKVEKEPTDQTYIKLKNGEYVKEMATIQPISYSFVKKNVKDFDAYLVRKQTPAGVQNVIVDKDYFSKHGDSAEMSLSNAYKIKRTQFKNCDIIQTTSKNQEVEQCRVLKNYDETAKAFNTDIANKDTVMLDEAKAFVVGYSKGLYNLDSVYHNGKLEELEKKKNRYEQTDTMYYNDDAEKSVTTEQITIKDGKAVGGPKYNVKRANKNALKKLWTIFGYTIGPAIACGIFIPVVGPIVSSALLIGTIVATPLIPVLNGIIGAVKNSPRIKFKDKTKLNRKSRVKEIHKETQLLYERMTNNKVYIPLSERQFLEQFSLLENKIISLAATSCENGFEVKNGVATVNAGNANKAKKFKNEYNKEEKQLKKLSKEATSANESYEKLKAKVEKYQNAGKVVPAKLQAKFDKAKEEHENADKKYNDLKNSHQNKFNNYKVEPDFYEADKSLNENLRIAREMRTIVYIKKFPDSDVVKEFLAKLSDEEKELLKELKFDKRKGVSLGKWKLNDKQENVEKYSGRDEEYKKAWIKVQAEIKVLAENIERQNNPVVTVEPVPSEKVVKPDEPKVIVEEVKVEKTRLSKKTLEELLKNVDELARLDQVYLGADDEIPSDIDEQIASLEMKIEKNKHLLSKAMKSSTNAYHVYKERIIEAEKAIKKHRISYNNKKDIKINV